jgi:hypothetical protein
MITTGNPLRITYLSILKKSLQFPPLLKNAIRLLDQKNATRTTKTHKKYLLHLKKSLNIATTM